MRYRFLPNGVLQGMISCLYDVENSLPINVTLGKVESEKEPVFQDHLPFLESQDVKKWFNDPILLFDRLYIDYSIFTELSQRKFKFCIRSKTSCTFNLIKDFVKSDKTDAILNFKLPYSQKKYVESKGLPEEVKLRAIKVELDSGEIEILITNL